MNRKESRYIPLISRNESFKLDADEICYVFRINRKLQFFTDSGIRSTYGKIDVAAAYLGPDFFRCTTGCLINLSRIRAVSGQVVYFDNGLTISPGKDTYLKIKKMFNAYLLNLLCTTDSNENE